MRIITAPEPEGKIRPATREEVEAAAIFTLTREKWDAECLRELFGEFMRKRALHEPWHGSEFPPSRGKRQRRGERVVLETCTFKWVEVMGLEAFPELQRELRKHGAIPSTEWCEAIRRMPREQRPFPCAIADAPFVYMNDGKVFPCVYVNGTVNFLPAAEGDYTGWRWLVEV